MQSLMQCPPFLSLSLSLPLFLSLSHFYFLTLSKPIICRGHTCTVVTNALLPTDHKCGGIHIKRGKLFIKTHPFVNPQPGTLKSLSTYEGETQFKASPQPAHSDGVDRATLVVGTRVAVDVTRAAVEGMPHQDTVQILQDPRQHDQQQVSMTDGQSKFELLPSTHIESGDVNCIPGEERDQRSYEEIDQRKGIDHQLEKCSANLLYCSKVSQQKPQTSIIEIKGGGFNNLVDQECIKFVLVLLYYTRDMRTN